MFFSRGRLSLRCLQGSFLPVWAVVVGLLLTGAAPRSSGRLLCYIRADGPREQSKNETRVPSLTWSAFLLLRFLEIFPKTFELDIAARSHFYAGLFECLPVGVGLCHPSRTPSTGNQPFNRLEA